MRFVLFVIFFTIIAYYLIRRFPLSAKDSTQKRSAGEPIMGSPKDKRRAGQMDSADTVFDEICMSYISKEGALKTEKNGVARYFCSEQCRRTFEDSKRGPY